MISTKAEVCRFEILKQFLHEMSLNDANLNIE